MPIRSLTGFRGKRSIGRLSEPSRGHGRPRGGNGGLMDDLEGVVWAGLLLVVGLLMAVFVIGCFGDHLTAKNESHTGTVSAVVYTPSQTGIGPAIGGNGGVAITTTSEEWTIVVTVNGKPHPVSVTPERWAGFKVGQQVQVTMFCGGWTGSVLSTRID